MQSMEQEPPTEVLYLRISKSLHDMVRAHMGRMPVYPTRTLNRAAIELLQVGLQTVAAAKELPPKLVRQLDRLNAALQEPDRRVVRGPQLALPGTTKRKPARTWAAKIGKAKRGKVRK